MTTIRIRVKSNSFAKSLVKTLTGHKEIDLIEMEKPGTSKENYVLPGKAMSKIEFQKKIREAEKSDLISNEEANEMIHTWLSRKRK